MSQNYIYIYCGVVYDEVCIYIHIQYDIIITTSHAHTYIHAYELLIWVMCAYDVVVVYVYGVVIVVDGVI